MHTQNNNFGKNTKKIPVKVYTDKQNQLVDDVDLKKEQNPIETRFQKIIDTIKDVKREIETSDEKVGKPKTHNYQKKIKDKTIHHSSRNPYSTEQMTEANQKFNMQNYNIEQDFEDIEKDKDIIKKKKILWICVGFGSLIIIISWISILMYIDFFKVNIDDFQNSTLNIDIKDNYNKFTEIIDTLKTDINNNPSVDGRD